MLRHPEPPEWRVEPTTCGNNNRVSPLD